MKRISLLALAMLSAAPAVSIELSLEENRAERGSVGYVDMQRLFINSPDAQRAKAGFEELVRQAEERVNLSKAELIRLRQLIAARRIERDALAASTAPTPAPATPTPPAPATQAAPQVAASTAAVMADLMAKGISLPGMSASNNSPAGPPTGSTGVAPTPITEVSSAVPAAVSSSASVVTAPSPVAVIAVASYAQRLLELDGQIISLDAEIQRKEAELAREHDEADHGLLDVENRKTDQVLARLYRAITVVAHREGVSVVVDKTTILYGHPAVDITGKVLQYLKEATPP